MVGCKTVLCSVQYPNDSHTGTFFFVGCLFFGGFFLGLAEACSDNTMNQSLGSLAQCPNGQGLFINNYSFAKLSCVLTHALLKHCESQLVYQHRDLRCFLIFWLGAGGKLSQKVG